MKYSVPIPQDQGIWLTSNSISQHISNILPEKVIIRIYGTVGAGKGTISSILSEYFNIPNLDSGRIWRAITYICVTNSKESTKENVLDAFSSISILPKKNVFAIYWKEKELTDVELRGPHIDPYITNYSMFRDAYNAFLQNFFDTYTGSIILDGRGSLTPYLQHAIRIGFTLIPILLTVNINEAARRRAQDYLTKYEPSHSAHDHASTEYYKLVEDIKQKIEKRDNDDYQININQNLGWVLPYSGIIDTTNYTRHEVFQISASFIQQSLQKK